MSYTANTFVAGEVPTVSIWNELWANDASFNNGTGIGAGAILAASLGLSGSFAGGVTSYANGGSASGTFYYINLGGMKLLWGSGNVATLSGTAPQSATVTVTVTAAGFSTIQNAMSSMTAVASTDSLMTSIDSATTSTVTVRVTSATGSGGSGQFDLFVIGT